MYFIPPSQSTVKSNVDRVSAVNIPTDDIFTPKTVCVPSDGSSVALFTLTLAPLMRTKVLWYAVTLTAFVQDTPVVPQGTFSAVIENSPLTSTAR